jgi:hypothetical protein
MEQIPRPVLGMPDVPLLFENAEMGADRRVTRRVWQSSEDLLGGGLPQPVENVEDLTFAAA